ncbi:MAG: hypothetical protein Kow0059_08020 [Candidatus Sumerlaeia bacterium]
MFRLMTSPFAQRQNAPGRKASAGGASHGLSGVRIIALRWAVIYAAASALWIIVSDKLTQAVSPDIKWLTQLQTSKGLIFITITTVIIYLLLLRDLWRYTQSERKLLASLDALARERDLIQSILNTADVMIVLLDRDGRLIQFNQMAESLTGRSSSDAEGVVFWDEFVPESERRDFAQVFHRIVQGEFPLQHENHILQREGATRLIAWRNTAVRNASGDIQFVVAIGIDVTTQRANERELLRYRSQLEELVNVRTQQMEEREQFFRRVFDHVFDGILVIDERYDVVDANQGLLRLLNYSNEQIHNIKIGDIIAPSGVQQFYEAVSLLRSGSASVFFKTALRTQTGRELAVEAGGVLITQMGRPYTIWSFRDISQRLKAESEILKLSAAVQQSPIMMVIADTDGAVEYANPKFEQVTGYKLAAVNGTPMRQLIGPALRDEDYEDIRKTVAEHRAWRGEIRAMRHNGEPFWMLATIAPIFNEAGEITHIVLVGMDVTDKKQADLALQQFAEELAQKTADLNEALAKEKDLRELRSRFIAMVSHEIRTPLTTIQSACDVLLRYRDKLSPDESAGRLHKIQQQVAIMTRMLEDVLILGEGDASVKSPPKRVPLEQLFSEVVDDLNSIKPPQCTFRYNLRTDRDHLTVDDKRLRRIIMNLLTNAIKYSPNGGRVYFSVVCVNMILSIVVQDEGLGIPESEMELIFTPFHRGSNVGNIQGTGLGLAIVKQAVDELGGTISVRSTEGHGSIFTVTIPLTA